MYAGISDPMGRTFKQNVAGGTRDRDTHRFLFWMYITCNRDSTVEAAEPRMAHGGKGPASTPSPPESLCPKGTALAGVPRGGGALVSLPWGSLN